jgi:hypothetical protein
LGDGHSGIVRGSRRAYGYRWANDGRACVHACHQPNYNGDAFTRDLGFVPHRARTKYGKASLRQSGSAFGAAGLWHA